MSKPIDKAIECDNKRPKDDLKMLVHSAIGLSFMLLFPLLPPFEPITPVGMHILGIFIGMVYLWSALNSIWPSIFGIVLMGLSGITGAEGYAGIKLAALDAFGAETILIVMLSMILFGAIEYVGCTDYLARWFLTRKIINGRPYMFIFVFFLASFVLSGLTSPIASLLIFWPISVQFMAEFGIEKCDKAYPVFIIGVYLSAAVAQPMFPFKGAALIVTGAFTKITQIEVNYLAYVLLNIIMSLVMLLAYMLWIRFVIRPDLSSLKHIHTDHFKKTPLPPMNLQQKLLLCFMFIYVLLLLAPSFLPASIPGIALLKKLGTFGVTVVCITILMIFPINGKPALPFKAVAAKNFSWDVYFLVAAAVYGANAVSNDATGIKPFLIQLLQPLLGGRTQLLFLFLIMGFALLIANFANHAGMAVVLLPIILAFADQYPGIDKVDISMTVCMMVFVALLTPAASPYAGMMHARKDLISFADILKIGIPLCLMALVLYVVIGYPLAAFLFGHLGA